MSVLVVGSLNADCVARCDRIPRPGETVTGKSFNISLGGKGANQAFASKRMGSETVMAGAVGKDSFGDRIVSAFAEEGFDTNHIKRADSCTGTCLINVEEGGQNCICVVPGANLDYSPEDLRGVMPALLGASYVVSQFEIGSETVSELARLCKENGKRLILNPAPARKTDKSILDGLFLLTPNETELSALLETDRTFRTVQAYADAARKLLDCGVQNVIVTLGTAGSVLVNREGTEFVPAFRVNAVDTVGAGDAYTGTLASMLDQGYTLKEAMRVATAASALEVQKEGAIPAMPRREDVFAFLREQEKITKA